MTDRRPSKSYEDLLKEANEAVCQAAYARAWQMGSEIGSEIDTPEYAIGEVLADIAVRNDVAFIWIALALALAG